MKVSIIIPIYNSVRYLENCIQSILKQTYQNWELLLVDDGSTDGSQEVARHFEENDSRIKLYVQKNQGVSVARNFGLSKSSGDFVSFVDSDDMLVSSALQDCLDCIDSDVDIVRTAYVRKTHSREDLIKFRYSGFFRKEEIRSMVLPEYVGPESLTVSSAFCSVWSCLFRRECLSGLSFQRVEVMEDKLFFLEALLKARKIVYLDKGLYIYRIIQGSAGGRYHNAHTENLLYVCRYVEMLLKENGLFEVNEKRYRRFVVACRISLIYNEIISSNKVQVSLDRIRFFTNEINLASMMTPTLMKEIRQVDKSWCLEERGLFPLYFWLKKIYKRIVKYIRKK